MTASLIGKAKESIDGTVDAYFGRALLLVGIVAAAAFSTAAVWMLIRDFAGPIIANFALALLFLLICLGLRASIKAQEVRVDAKLADVEETIETATASAFPADLSSVATYLPLVLPVLKRFRVIVPLVAVAVIVLLLWPQNRARTETT